jgi:hypothetical protein
MCRLYLRYGTMDEKIPQQIGVWDSCQVGRISLLAMLRWITKSECHSEYATACATLLRMKETSFMIREFRFKHVTPLPVPSPRCLRQQGEGALGS